VVSISHHLLSFSLFSSFLFCLCLCRRMICMQISLAYLAMQL
ncbi:hypothetical protein CSUI_004497, partial [Cystoisospora suis]